ncbi:MAG: hypothetical protein V4662_05880 [Verrucomicrobiota bacterium]
MPIGSAVTAILAFALCIFVLRMGHDTKLWRLWWMDLLGVLDVDTDRVARKAQERQMTLMCHVLFVLLAAVCVSCIYWTVDGIRELRRDKTVMEREIDMGREEIEGVRKKLAR